MQTYSNCLLVLLYIIFFTDQIKQNGIVPFKDRKTYFLYKAFINAYTWMYAFILRNVLGLLSTLFAASNISLWVEKFRLSHGSLLSRHLLIMISPETPYKFMPNTFHKVMNPVYPRKEGQCLYLPHLPWAQLIGLDVFFFLTSAINRQTARSNTSRCTAVRETQ